MDKNIDWESFQPKNDDGKESNENTVKNPIDTVTIFKAIIIILGIIITIFVIIVRVNGGVGSGSKGGSGRNTKCYYCGKTENCYKYDLQYLDGVNPNGSYKFGHNTVYMSYECADKARNSGKYTYVGKH